MTWAKLKEQGVGIMVFRSYKTSNHWLRDPIRSGLKESEVILALKVRTNTFPTVAVLKRFTHGANRRCRLCNQGLETLRHMISKCPNVKANQMRNHNAICDMLRKEGVDRGWQVLQEKD